MKKDKKSKKGKKGKKKGEWSAYDEIRHPTPKCGFAFKDKKKALKDEESRNQIKEYYDND